MADDAANSPAETHILACAVQFFRAQTGPVGASPAQPIYRRTLKGFHWHQKRDIEIELCRELRLTVRDAGSKAVLARSLPGRLSVLDTTVEEAGND